MGAFTTVAAGADRSIAAGATHVYCIDFEADSAGNAYMMAAWPKRCGDVQDSERSGGMGVFPIMQMHMGMNLPSYATGAKVGFVLSGVSLNSFEVGTIVSQVN
jgi:hypothetical protein